MAEESVAESAVSEGARQTILVFTGELLPPSQTFVRDHVANIRQYDRLLLGVRRVAGLDLSQFETATLPSSRTARLILWLFGRSPHLDALVRKHDVALIHAHFADTGMKIAQYARRRKLPLFVTLHGTDVLRVRRPPLPMRLLNAYLRSGMRKWTTQFLAVSNYLRRSAVAVGYPEHKVVTHLLGIPLPDVPERSGTGAADPVILFVGRLVENKGLAYLLSACSQLSAQGSRFRLRVVGDGPLAPEYRAQAQPLGACVQFLGFLSPSQVQEQLVSADIFCMPSTRAPNGDNEGLGLVYLEAQGAGLPVVAFDQGPIPEAVLDGVTGVLAEDKSAESLAAALQRLIDNPDLRHKMGVAGRRFVEERFDIRKQSRELDRLYSAAISGEVVS